MAAVEQPGAVAVADDVTIASFKSHYGAPIIRAYVSTLQQGGAPEALAILTKVKKKGARRSLGTGRRRLASEMGFVVAAVVDKDVLASATATMSKSSEIVAAIKEEVAKDPVLPAIAPAFEPPAEQSFEVMLAATKAEVEEVGNQVAAATEAMAEAETMQRQAVAAAQAAESAQKEAEAAKATCSTMTSDDCERHGMKLDPAKADEPCATDVCTADDAATCCVGDDDDGETIADDGETIEDDGETVISGAVCRAHGVASAVSIFAAIAVLAAANSPVV